MLASEPEPEPELMLKPPPPAPGREGEAELVALVQLLPALTAAGLAQLLKAGMQVELERPVDEAAVAAVLVEAGCSTRKGQRRVVRRC